MRTEIDQSEVKNWLKPTVAKLSNSKNHIKMDLSLKKLETLLKKQLSLDSSGDEIEELPSSLNLEAITKETRSIRTNTTVSLPSAFKSEKISPVDPNKVCMSIVPRVIKIVSKITSFPELFILQFFESNYVSDPQLRAIRDLIKMKDPKPTKKVLAMNCYYFQFVRSVQPPVRT